jgi:hypothetical protein
MTADELQRIALRLSNSGYCRHWLHWNDPSQEPWLMAIRVIDSSGWRVPIKDLETRGFRLDAHPGYFYTVERTNEDGTPFRTNL